MRDCEHAKALLFARGYGAPGMTVAAIAALVPEVASSVADYFLEIRPPYVYDNSSKKWGMYGKNHV